MKLQTIIGKLKGRIKSGDRLLIMSYLNKVVNNSNYNCHNVCNSELSGEAIEESNRDGANLYIGFGELRDPVSFYQFLSENGYVVKDSKITMEAGE